MKRLEEVLELLQADIGRQEVENYITHGWIRPDKQDDDWHFAEIDIARIRLISHLIRDIQVNEEAMDVVLSLLDQLYEVRSQMKQLSHAITLQPQQVQAEIITIVRKLTSIE